MFTGGDFESWPHNWPPLLKQGGGLQFGLSVIQSVIGVTGRFMGVVLGAT